MTHSKEYIQVKRYISFTKIKNIIPQIREEELMDILGVFNESGEDKFLLRGSDNGSVEVVEKMCNFSTLSVSHFFYFNQRPQKLSILTLEKSICSIKTQKDINMSLLVHYFYILIKLKSIKINELFTIYHGYNDCAVFRIYRILIYQ